MRVNKGIEGQSISPAAWEFLHIYIGVTGRSYADTISVELLWQSAEHHWHHHQPENKIGCE